MRLLDLFCGAGGCSVGYHQAGFDVTGVDISTSAIALAEANAKNKGVTCRFVVA